MNATTNTLHPVVAEILCRFDPAKGVPVVFITTQMEGNNIPAWTKGDAEMMPIEYYHTSLPLSAADEKILAARYAKHFNLQHVTIRHRLPRTVRVVENRIAKGAAAPAPAPVAAAPVVTPPAAPVAAPQAPAANEPIIAAKTAPKGTSARKAPAKKAAAKKAAAKKGQRRPAAKSIMAQPAPDAAPVVSVAPIAQPPAVERRQQAQPALEAKVDQLAAIVAQLATVVGAQITAK